MRIDRYTKATLTIIAIALLAIAYNQTIGTGRVAHAAGKFADVQFSGMPQGLTAIDTRTGDIWGYEQQGLGRGGMVEYIGRLTELGKPLVKDPSVKK